MSAPTHDLETVRDWLRYAVSRFGEAKLAFGHGTTNAYDEAAYLVLHALHLPLGRLDPFLDARLTQSERMQVAQILDRRIERRVPAAYLTQEAWLGEFRFYVDERVIIPRSYIAELLPDGLAPYVGARSSSRARSTSAPDRVALRFFSPTPTPPSTSTRSTSRTTRSPSPSAMSPTTGLPTGSTSSAPTSSRISPERATT
jgi:hypothetical protein